MGGEKPTTDSGFLNNQIDFINFHSPNESTSAFPASLNLLGRSLAISLTKQTFLFLGFLKNQNKLSGGAYFPTISPLVHFALSPTTYEKIGHKHFINRLSGQLKPAARSPFGLA